MSLTFSGQTEYRVTRWGPSARSAENSRDLIRSDAHQRRLAEAKAVGAEIAGAAVVGLYADPRRFVVAFSNGLYLSALPGSGVAGAAAVWHLDPGDGSVAAGVAGRGLPASGTVRFRLPSGAAYAWRWREIAARLVGATAVACSAGFRDFNLHCRDVELEFDVWAVEPPAGPPDEILIFMPL